MDLTYSSTHFPSLETKELKSLGELSAELLAHSTLVSNSSQNLGLYNDTVEYGDPMEDADYWREQDGANSCAVVAQISVYESLTGEFITEADAVDYATEAGLFDPEGGTSEENVGDILEDLGIATTRSYDTSFTDLEYALEAGDKVIVGLDSNEIWFPEYNRNGDSLEQEDAGHAVWVTGINYEFDGSVDIILNDSGIPNGSSSVVEYDDFMNAWEDRDFFAAIAENPFV